jgi:uncharacterized protein YcnI
MRCSGWSSLAISVCSALVLTGTASAHVVATSPFVASESSRLINLEAPNERSEPMTSLLVRAPSGLVIHHTRQPKGWSGVAEGTSATFAGGSLPAGQVATFGVYIKADAQPGTETLEAKQRYDSGAVVTWQVPITITPAAETPSQNLALAAVVGLIGILVVAAIVMLAWRRRAATST